jgi:pimeloyl-ACP methyl ester carboxylesterase
MATSWRWSIEHGMTVRRFGAGPEIVWIHGLGESSVSFDAIAQHPALAAFSHTLPDLPGYGRSAWTDAPASLEALATWLGAWLGDRGGDKVTLVGHSMGGVLAVLLAERDVPRAIVNIDGNISRGDCNFSGVAAGYSLPDFRAHGLAAMRDAVYRDGVDKPALRGYHAAMCNASPDVFHGHARDLVAMSEREDLAPRFAALRIPRLYVAGVPDGICARSRELLAAHDARWIGIEPAGHWVYLDQPDAFADALAAFAA